MSGHYLGPAPDGGHFEREKDGRLIHVTDCFQAPTDEPPAHVAEEG